MYILCIYVYLYGTYMYRQAMPKPPKRGSLIETERHLRDARKRRRRTEHAVKVSPYTRNPNK